MSTWNSNNLSIYTLEGLTKYYYDYEQDVSIDDVFMLYFQDQMSL